MYSIKQKGSRWVQNQIIRLSNYFRWCIFVLLLLVAGIVKGDLAVWLVETNKNTSDHSRKIIGSKQRNNVRLQLTVSLKNHFLFHIELKSACTILCKPHRSFGIQTITIPIVLVCIIDFISCITQITPFFEKQRTQGTCQTSICVH